MSGKMLCAPVGMPKVLKSLLKTRRHTERQVISLFFLISLICWPAIPSFADGLTPQIIEYALPTGQTLYIREDHSKPIVTIDTWVKTGSVNETTENNGVSHFLEHLLFKGTDTHKVGEIDRLLESRGAQFNAATSDDYTHYYITTASPYFEEALRLHANMLLNATIPDAELTRERKVVQEEINRANDNPDRQLYNTLAQLMYGEHGYALDTLGPKETIAGIPREKILDYYHYWYQPARFNTVIAGDVNPAEVKRLVAEVFRATPFEKPKGYQPPEVGPVPIPESSRAKILENPNISQAYVAIGLLGPPQQKPEDVYALDIAMLALGSGKSSRLYQALKENRPLATSVSARNYTQKHSGLIMLYATAAPENRETVKRELLAQVARLKAHGITAAELEKAKTQYLKDFIFENETTGGVASSIGYNVTIGNLKDYLNHVSNVERVTLDRVETALGQYMDLNRAVMVELLPANTIQKASLDAETQRNLALLKNPPAPTTTSLSETSAKQEISPEQTEPIRTILPNGMTLLLKPIKTSRTVAIKLFIKGGQGTEAKPGIAPLVSSVLMQGTQNRTAEMISRELESQGMSLSVSSDEDFIEITGAAIREDLGELFVLLKDILTAPSFQESEIAKKKQQMKQAILASRDNPSSVAFENLNLALYPDHPYGNEGQRIEAHLDTLSRQDMLDYYHLSFRPTNMVMSVVGNIDSEAVSNYMASLYPPCQQCKPELASIPPVPSLLKTETVTKEKARLSAVWMAQGWLAPSISNTRDYAALKVINSLIGTGMSSRLFVDLREKQGLAYVVGSLYPSRDQQSRFVIYIGTDPVNTEKVIAGFKSEIQRLQTEPVPPDELAEAKSKLIGGFALAHDTNINQAYYLGFYEVLNAGYQFDATYPNLIEQVTASDIQRVAQLYLSAPSVLSLVKPSTGKTD